MPRKSPTRSIKKAIKNIAKNRGLKPTHVNWLTKQRAIQRSGIRFGQEGIAIRNIPGAKPKTNPGKIVYLYKGNRKYTSEPIEHALKRLKRQ